MTDKHPLDPLCRQKYETDMVDRISKRLEREYHGPIPQPKNRGMR